MDMHEHDQMKATRMRSVLLLRMLSYFLVAAASSSCHPGDRAALLAIKAAFGNPNHLVSWTPDSSCCDWSEVYCDDTSTHRVVGLRISYTANITGTIPDAIAGLVHLEDLDLRHLRGLSGPIPPAIAKLSNLSTLTISWTGVSGPVPSFLSQLTALTELDLSYNSLTGSIPASLSLLPNLVSIDIRHNRLTGSLPPLLLSKASEDDNEIYLWLSHNNLSGSVPAEWSTVKFQQVDLSHNSLTGDASALLGAAKPLWYMNLSRNALSFNLSSVELPEELLTYMDVSHNAIYGGIPAQVAKVTNLAYLTFDVSYNRLCGEVPASMASFDAHSFQHNKCLCGAPLPPCRRPAVD